MKASSSAIRRIWLLVFVILLGLLVATLWDQFRDSNELVAVRRELVAVMGTSSQILAVIPRGEAPRAAQILDAGESELRRLEAVFSTWIQASELSRLNAAPSGVDVQLSGEVIRLLRMARELNDETQGAFDVTAGPVITTWRVAAAANKLPSTADLESARLASSWDDLRLSPTTVTKLRDSVRLDVDGIAKGHAIDSAVDAMIEAGASGALVEVGGDLRVVGSPAEGTTWPIGIRSPFSAGPFASFDVEHGAVCTSGAYARPLEIEGKTFSHIVDPRTGHPVQVAASVTVIAPRASTADAWATALSVLGVPGVRWIPEDSGIQALLILGSKENPSIVATSGFPQLSSERELTVERN